MKARYAVYQSRRRAAAMNKGVIVFCLFVVAVHSASLPSGITTCKKSSADYDKCIKEAVRDSIKSLAKGSKELNLPVLDPIAIPKIHIPGNGGNVDLEQTYTDLKIHGMTDSDYSSVKIDTDGDKCKIDLELFSPHVELIGQLQVKGKLLLFTLGGHGPANITIVNLKTKLVSKCKKIEKKGETFLDITGTTLDLNPEKCIFDIKNLVDGNEALSANILNVMNENNLEIFSELKRDYEQALKAVIQSLASTFFKKISTNKVFLP